MRLCNLCSACISALLLDNPHSPLLTANAELPSPSTPHPHRAHADRRESKQLYTIDRAPQFPNRVEPPKFCSDTPKAARAPPFIGLRPGIAFCAIQSAASASPSMASLADHPRLVVVGTSCCGTTSFSRRLAELLDRPHVELDALHWRSNWTPNADFASPKDWRMLRRFASPASLDVDSTA